MVLVGVQPVLIQVPPTGPCSMTAVFHPAWARARASGLPACPVPITTPSKYSRVVVMGPNLHAERRDTPGLPTIPDSPRLAEPAPLWILASGRRQPPDA